VEVYRGDSIKISTISPHTDGHGNFTACAHDDDVNWAVGNDDTFFGVGGVLRLGLFDTGDLDCASVVHFTGCRAALYIYIYIYPQKRSKEHVILGDLCDSNPVLLLP